MQQGKLTLEQILECDTPIRKALDIFSRCVDHVYTADVRILSIVTLNILISLPFLF